MAWLVCVKGPDRGLQLEVSDQVVTIGRSPDNTVRVSEEKASRHHCQLTPMEDAIELADLNSTNGTQAPERRLRGQAVHLKLGDSFAIGKDIFEYRRSPDRAMLRRLKTEQQLTALPLDRGKEQTQFDTSPELPRTRPRFPFFGSFFRRGSGDHSR